MSERFDDPVPSPDDEVPPTERPPRPVLVELGAAILIVGGITAIMGWLVTQVVAPTVPADAGLPPILFMALNGLTIAIGILMRQARYWRLCVNVVAIATFLYLISAPNPIAVFYAALDVVALFALVRYRHWFAWRPPTATIAP